MCQALVPQGNVIHERSTHSWFDAHNNIAFSLEKLCFSLLHGYHPNPATHRNSNTYLNKNTRPTWWSNRKVADSWWWMYWCPKYVEYRSEVKHNNWWHQIGLLFFNCHNDARSNIRKIYNVTVWKVWTWSGSRKNRSFFWRGGGECIEFMVRPEY
jgi:hypothetical protein